VVDDAGDELRDVLWMNVLHDGKGGEEDDGGRF
jgi:hypothetical protein